ncbi:MAG: hypothetical protein WBX02_10475 [Terriglobales bacterium]
MHKFVALIIFLGLFSLPLTAQSRLEVFGGYQYLHIGGSDGVSGQGFNGWDAAVTGYFNKFVGVTGDFSGAYKTLDGVSAHVYSYSGGPVVAFREGKVNPFAHFLVGGETTGASADGVTVSTNGFTMMFGGGVDVKVAHDISYRVADVDWVYYHFGGVDGGPSSSQSNNVRITTGIVLRF